MTISRRDRFRGTLVGVLAGDALGAPYEWQKGEQIRADFDARGGLVPFDYLDPWKKMRQMPKGHPTDDSELTAALAHSIVERGRLDLEHLYGNLRTFIHDRKTYLSGGKAYGSGGTLRAALKYPTYADSCTAFDRGEIDLIPTNGSLMRTAPIALMPRENLALMALARSQSRVTHRHVASQDACAACVSLLSSVLQGVQPTEAWEYALSQTIATSPGGRDDISPFMTMCPIRPCEEEIWPQCGSVLLTLKSSVWAAVEAEDFRDGLTKVIGLGGDVDTTGAIAGGLLGARFGYEGIPQEWRDVLIGREKMLELADKLYGLAHPAG